MAIIVGSARGDERGKTKGGKAGDQKQTSSTNDMKGEVSMQNFYVHSKGWRVLRPKSVKHANDIAENMRRACNNPKIGYDQNQRLGTEKYGIDTKTLTETDCSALSRECIEDATGVEIPNYTTANQEKVLEATGLFYDAFTFVSLTKTPIFNGDVLVTCRQGHTVIVVSGNPRKAETKPSVNTSGKIDSAKSFSENYAGKYTTTADLHLRAGAGTSKKSIMVMKKGTDVQNYGYYTKVDGTVWLLVKCGDKTGFCSKKYLK